MFSVSKDDQADFALPGNGSKARASESSIYARFLTRRPGKTGVAVLVVCGVIAVAFFFFGLPQYSISLPVSEENHHASPPPLYSWYHEQEQLLPQHNLDLPYPEGRHGKYIWIANHVDNSGWGNYLQDMIMTAHLAYASGRGFVFNNYTWSRNGPDFSEYNGKQIPSRIPMSALISGPIVGGNFVNGDSTPRAISPEFFAKVCPHPTVLRGDDMHKALNKDSPTADELINKWAEHLNSLEDRCIEIDRNSARTFDVYMFGDKGRMLDVWPSLSKSPIITLFGWSPLVQSAFDTNRHLFAPVSATEPYTSPAPFLRASDPYAPLPGLLALHIRRGDFEGHCVHLAKWTSDFNAFNSFPELVDQFQKPTEGGWGETTEENLQFYLRHCYPSIEQIVERVEHVRQTHSGLGLQNIYIMTNGEKSWLAELEVALKKAGQWNQIVTSRDLVLNSEQKYVAQAVDMLIGQRAQMFIGNGFSSLTSHITAMRVARQFPPDSTRFWM